MSANKTIVLVTGSNTGLGLATVKSLWESSKQYHIFAAGRNATSIQNAIVEIQRTPSIGSSTIEAIQLDISDDPSIYKAVSYVQEQYGRIDVLINNAGGGFDTDYQNGTLSQRDAWNRTVDLNVTSPQVMTTEFAPLLLKSADPRLVFITSSMASLSEEHSRTTTGEGRMRRYAAGWPKEGRTASSNAYAYRVSKAALNMMVLHWLRLFEEDGVKVFNVSPGFLATGLAGDPEVMRKAGAADPSVGAEFVRGVVEGERDQNAGVIVKRDGLIQPW